MFNEYQWENYLKAGGDKIVKLFEEVTDDSIHGFDKLCATIGELHKCYCPDKFINQAVKTGVVEFFADFDLDQTAPFFKKNAKYTCEKACLKVWDTIKKDLELKKDSEVLEKFTSNVYCQVYLTTQLAKERPEIFIPYYFYGNFNVLTYIVETFGVELDVKNLPVKKDYKGRFMYYGKVCEAFQNFREDDNLSVAELWAFLYDYAPKCVGGLQYIKPELPKPKSAFLIGSPADDEFLSEYKKEPSNYISLWQCNPDTRAGDMAVMYLRTPYSRLDSVWRSICEGFNDPFFWYYRCTYIGQPKKLNKKNCFILKQMRDDSVLGELPIVKKNMQGVNGVELPPSVYNYIVQQNENIEKIKYEPISNRRKINTEHDVETKLLEPLLEKLGWKKGDYVIKPVLKMGRNNKEIPDYVILPTHTPYRETAHFVWEAKKSINNNKQLEKDIGQAISYARRLNAKGCALISQEGVWVMQRADDYENIIFKASWNELKKDDVFKKLLDIAGK